MHKFLTAALATTALAAFAGSASAAVIIANPSSFNGETILFNSNGGAGVTGTTISGFSNQSNTEYLFSGTTTDGSGVLHGSGGQATITANAANSAITGISFVRADGGLFDDVEFRLFGINGANATVSFAILGSDNVTYNFLNQAFGGDNRFAFEGTSGTTIRSVSYTINSGSIDEHRQTRVDNAGAVPEPATWAMMLAGFGLVGAGMRRRKTETRVRFAI